MHPLRRFARWAYAPTLSYTDRLSAQSDLTTTLRFRLRGKYYAFKLHADLLAEIRRTGKPA